MTSRARTRAGPPRAVTSVGRRFAVAAGLMVLAACGNPADRTTGAAQITIHPAPGARPDRVDTDLALEVLGARLKSLGITAYSLSAEEDITIVLGEAEDERLARSAAGLRGVVAFLTQSADESLPSNGADLSGRVPLLPPGSVVSAATATDDQGPVIDIELSDAASDTLREWSTTHVGHYLLVVVDGRVVATPVIMSPITGPILRLTIVDDSPDIPFEVLAAILDSGPLPEAWQDRH